MAAFSGKDGDVQVGATSVAEVTKWSADHKVESDRFGSNTSQGWKKTVTGQEEITGSIEGKLQSGDAEPFSVGSTVTLTLITGGGLQLAGNAVITNLSYEVDMDTGKAVTFKADFESDGPWTIGGGGGGGGGG